jgi:spermidine synthase
MENNVYKNPPIGLLLLSLGFGEQLAQVVLLRELFDVFFGSEASLGIILSAWMLFMAIGAAAGGLWAGRLKRPRAVFLALSALAGLALVAAVCASRCLRAVLAAAPGEHFSFATTAVSSVALIAIVCPLFGFLFVLGVRLLRETRLAAVSEDTDAEAKRASGSAYAFESLGHVLGGLLFSFVLVYFLGSFSLAFLLIAVNFAVFVIASPRGKSRLPRIAAAVGAVLFTAALFAAPAVDRYFLGLRWKASHPGYTFVESARSPYQRIVVMKYGGQYTFFGNGEILMTVPSPERAEERATLGMLQHPAPRRVLLLGGGAAGLVREALRYGSVESVDYVEIDAKVIELAGKYLSEVSPADAAALEDSKVSIHHEDARYFVKRAPKKYDVIISDLPEAQTAALNRFYTVEFFREVARALSTDGVFITHVHLELPAEGNIALLAGSVFHSLRSVFPEVLVAPDGTLIAAKRRGAATLDAAELEARFRRSGVAPLRYGTERRFTQVIQSERLRLARETLMSAVRPRSADKKLLNTDFRPVTYYYNFLVWNRMVRAEPGGGFRWALGASLSWVLVPLGIMMLIFCVSVFRDRTEDRRSARKAAVFIAVAALGMFGLMAEVVLLFSFQSVYGYVYQMIGAIVAAFMAGLLAGTLVGNAVRVKVFDLSLLFVFVLGAAVFSFVLPQVLEGFTRLGPGIGSTFLFAVVTAAAGFFVGVVFPLVVKLYPAPVEKVGKITGLLYAADLFGACIAGVLSGAVLIPVAGFHSTCYFAGILIMAAAFMVVVATLKPRVR